MSYVGAMLVAMLLDAAFGWPAALYGKIGHPVTWIGRIISHFDRRFNLDDRSQSSRRFAGVVSALAVIAVSAIAAFIVQQALPAGWLGTLLAGICAWPLIAAHAMHRHVADVAAPLADGDLAAARTAVSMIVGRDPSSLDAAGVSRAAIESLAENTSDGVVAPIVWGTLLGLPGIAAYKAIDTLDSMIGHRTPRHEAFGWTAARIDDFANLLPARLTALLFVMSSPRPAAALECTFADARKHRSPNAGWPESAMAGALGVRLSGPRVYHNQTNAEPWLNALGRDPSAVDIAAALTLYLRAMCALAVILAALLVVLAAF